MGIFDNNFSSENIECMHEKLNIDNQRNQEEKILNKNVTTIDTRANNNFSDVIIALEKHLSQFKISHEVFAEKILGTNKKAFKKLCKVKSIDALTIAQHQYLNIINNWIKDNNQIFIDNENNSQVVKSARKRKKNGKVNGKMNQEIRSKKSKKVSVVTSRFKIKNTIVKKYRLMKKNKTFKSVNKSGKRTRTYFYKKLMKRNDCLLNVLK
jgi:hypothetical protein